VYEDPGVRKSSGGDFFSFTTFFNRGVVFKLDSIKLRHLGSVLPYL
jgi:hypothetical protein